MIPAERRTRSVRDMNVPIIPALYQNQRVSSTPQFGEHPVEAALELETGGRPPVLVLHNFGDVVAALVLAEQVRHFHAELLDIIPVGEDVSFLAHRTMPGDHSVEIELHGCI